MRSGKMKLVDIESGLYSQVVVIRSHTVVDKYKDSSSDPKIKYYFQGQSTQT